MQGARLVIIEGEVGHMLKLLRLVRIGLLRAEVVDTVLVFMPFFEKPLHIDHFVAVQACMGAAYGRVAGPPRE